jgi:hypothetical protein
LFPDARYKCTNKTKATHCLVIMRSTPTNYMAAFVFMATALGQTAPPSTGYQMGGPVRYPDSSEGPWVDVIMPMTITQCEPVLIYYNVSAWTGAGPIRLYLQTPTIESPNFLYLEFPYGSVGYLQWICNIPGGQGFIASVEPLYIEPDQYFLVEVGSSSACLGHLEPSYDTHLQYSTTEFDVYTTESFSSINFTTVWAGFHIPYAFAILLRIVQLNLIRSTTSYPTGSFSTILLNSASYPTGTFSTTTARCDFFFTDTHHTYLLPIAHPHHLAKNHMLLSLLVAQLAQSSSSY